ncbi:hypothetical protein IAQ61_006282 [Plenodomus lingam]|uniref:uncharacterized protein n=1 Tax=Leptosphaeria maculans TaxID=5022 RepID=UPI00332E2306|nr:hypothetical protein IAQ61_006282 [Plenodomus lingam]
MREIQDSDDDLDTIEVDIPPQQQQSKPVPQQEDSMSPQAHGTGSTESLRKALQKEHRAQFQSQSSQLETSLSLSENPSKRRKTSATPSLLQPGESTSPKQNGPVTSSKRSKSYFSSPLPSEPKYVATEIDLRSPHEPVWNLEGTTRENYAHHEPMAMFPEPSSTVANTTQTQLHVLERVRGPVMLGLSSEVDAPRNFFPPEPSVPWSDLMKLTPGDPLCLSGSSDPISESTSATPICWDAEVDSSASQKSRRGSSTIQKGSSLQYEIARDDCRPGDATVRPDKDSLIPKSSGSTTESLHNNKTGQGPSDVSKSQPQLQDEAIFDYDDELSIGLPRERYKPRPSRSRSLKTDTQDEIDYSVVPERAKKVSERRKTAEIPSSVEIPTTPQKIQQICDMGFTPDTTKRALKHNSGDITSTVDWLVTNGIGEDELASHPIPRKKPITPKSHDKAMDPEGLQVIMRELDEYRKEDSIHPENDAPALTTTDGTLHPNPIDKKHAVEHIDTVPVKSPKVQVIIQSKSPAKTPSDLQMSSGPPKKGSKRRKTTLDQPDSEPSTVSLELPMLLTEKKRGRGRPKKALEKPTSIDVVQETVPPKSSEEQQQPEALRAVQVNVASGSTSATDVVVDGAFVEGSEALIDEPLAHAHILEPEKKTSTKPQTSETSLKSPTPLNRGKVPYRVGLSKRARIAPLLRVLKK